MWCCTCGKLAGSFFPFFVHCSVENGLNFSDRPGNYIPLCRNLEHEVIWVHLVGRLKLDRSLSRRLKEKTLPAGPSPISPMKAKITISPIFNTGSRESAFTSQGPIPGNLVNGNRCLLPLPHSAYSYHRNSYLRIRASPCRSGLIKSRSTR